MPADERGVVIPLHIWNLICAARIEGWYEEDSRWDEVDSYILDDGGLYKSTYYYKIEEKK